MLSLVSKTESRGWVDTFNQERKRGVKKLNGPPSCIGPVMEYNWRINGPSMCEMERRRKTA